MQITDTLRNLADHVEFPQVRTRSAVPVLGLVILGAPLALGGAPAVTVPVFALLAFVALFIAGWDRGTLRRDPILPVVATLFTVSVIQLVPMPPWLLHWLDPVSADASARALEAFHIDLSHTWRALHYDPGTGLSDTVYLLGLGALYLATKRAVMRDALEPVYVLCATSALVIALLAMAHLATSQDKVYGVYTPAHALPPILSPLLNPNHLAALTGAGAILWIGQTLELRVPLERVLAGTAAILCGAVCAMSLSRGGVAAAVGGVAIFAALNARRPPEGHRKRKRDSRPLLGALLGAGVVVGGLYVAATSLGQEYHHGDVSKLENFRRALGLLRHRELLGVGSGGVTGAAALTGRLDPDYTFLRVESLPVDLVVSFGVVGAGVALYFGMRALRRWLPPAEAPATTLAAWAALLSLVVHDMVDFALFLGGVGYFAAALGGILAGHRAREWKHAVTPEPSRVTRWPALVAGALVALVGWTAAHATLEADRDRLEQDLRVRADAYRQPAVHAVFRRHPSDAYLQLLAGSYALTQRDPDALRFVNRALALAPTWAQPHLLLARVLGARNLRSQTLVEAHEALMRSRVVATPCAEVVARLTPPPTAEELDRTAPRAEQGLWFLERLSQEHGAAPELALAADAIQLARDPAALGPLLRQASGAFNRGDLTLAETSCTRLLHARPYDTYGYTCQAMVLERRGDVPGAVGLLESALTRVSDRYTLHAERARIFAGAHDAAGMRRETDMMIETSGPDLTRRINAHGVRGRYELALGNPGAAYEAYQVAEQLAVPEHPYLLDMARSAVAMHDRHALEAACVVLMEDPQGGEAEALCSRPSTGTAPGGPR